jgi:hypothetical protein
VPRTNSDEGFLGKYLNLVTNKRDSDPAMVAVWLFTNAKQMDETMFLEPSIDWEEVEPFDILVLRASTPPGVFTQKAKEGYLSQVEHDSKLAQIADAIFADDQGFINGLPEDLRVFKPQFTSLMRLAYEKGIRPASS